MTNRNEEIREFEKFIEAVRYWTQPWNSTYKLCIKGQKILSSLKEQPDLEAENERLEKVIKTAIQFHHKSIAECLAGHKDATAWLKSAEDLAEDEKHEIFSLWLLKQALKKGGALKS